MTGKTIKHACFTTSLLLTIFIFSCAHKPDLEAERRKLLVLHQALQDAHLNEDAGLLVEQSAENAISVNRGKISRVPKDSTVRRFKAYFANIEHKKWEDLNPPEIHFSEDATMAYVVVDKIVVTTYKDESGNPVEESTHFAWVSIYSKQADGQWKSVCIASTNEPSVVKTITQQGK